MRGKQIGTISLSEDRVSAYVMRAGRVAGGRTEVGRGNGRRGGGGWLMGVGGLLSCAGRRGGRRER